MQLSEDQTRWLVKAVEDLLDSCSPIDFYTYHSAPQSPIHDDWAEARLRVLLEEITGKHLYHFGSVSEYVMNDVRENLPRWKQTR